MTESNQRYSVKAPSRGGARKGAGRKPGATTQKTKEIAERAVQEGLTPLEVMLKVMREFLERAEAMFDGQVDGEGPKAKSKAELLKEAAEVASKAAPYIHPRLAAMEVTGKNGKDLVPEAPKGVLVVPGVLDEKVWEKMMSKLEGNA